MLIIALVLALVGLVALVFAVVTSNELVAWVCIGASVLGVVLLIVDALQERQRRDAVGAEEHEDQAHSEAHSEADAGDEAVDYPEEAPHEGGYESSGAPGAEATEESAVSAEGRGDEAAK
ncbi:hypothetical protein AWC17_02100 [Mycobacterium nebraskense]|uniref:Transmembrane protein n=1 Tax=Mycobacterium nebraskense TaxID=244292 RepID=A0A0F5MZN4_9MYCO|nr:hypothetical protein [Mycobacterium nebraskense]KKC00254.1 membrane protein [Mycobacterium nebraskense]KLO37282.1 membrane protein [Mycobacterium nebraskense]MCV7118696.1 hypothetical protein [Mycobacterium nebraskense]ORW24942.1 hypothetical protein AWC17_02100 [Mycobacterium nebraskense]